MATNRTKALAVDVVMPAIYTMVLKMLDIFQGVGLSPAQGIEILRAIIDGLELTNQEESNGKASS